MYEIFQIFILINFELTHRLIDGRMDAQKTPKAICTFNVFKNWEHNKTRANLVRRVYIGFND